MDEIFNDEVKWATYKGLFGNELSKNNKNSSLIRSMFFFGGPLNIDGKRYKDLYDNEKDQDDIFRTFSEDLLDIIEDEDLILPTNVKLYGYS